jgi:maleate cis-trans isomerase
MRTLTADDMAGYGEATIEAVAPFVSERPDIVVHGCTAGGFLAGPEGNARIVEQLARATGAPVISTADAMWRRCGTAASAAPPSSRRTCHR